MKNTPFTDYQVVSYNRSILHSRTIFEFLQGSDDGSGDDDDEEDAEA